MSKEYSREIAIKVDNPNAVLSHFDKYGYVIVKHLSYHIAFLHGSEDGRIPMLDKVQMIAKKSGIEVRGYVCCFPLACRKTHPGLNILGGWNSEQVMRIDKHEIRFLIA